MSITTSNPVTVNGAGAGSQNRMYCISKQERVGIGDKRGELCLSSSRFVYLATDVALMEFIISKYGSTMSSCRDKRQFFKRPTPSMEIRIGATCIELDGSQRVIDLTELFRIYTTSLVPPC